MLQRVADRGGRRGELSSRETYQRETWLRLPPDTMRGQEGLLGAVEVSPAQPDPPELAERPSHLTAQVRPQSSQATSASRSASSHAPRTA